MDDVKKKNYLSLILIFSTQLTSIFAFAANLSPALFGDGKGSTILSLLYLALWIAAAVFSIFYKNIRTATFGTVYFGIIVFCFTVRLLFPLFESFKVKITIYVISLFSIFFEVFLYPVFSSYITVISAVIFLLFFSLSLYLSKKGNINDNL